MPNEKKKMPLANAASKVVKASAPKQSMSSKPSRPTYSSSKNNSGESYKSGPPKLRKEDTRIPKGKYTGEKMSSLPMQKPMQKIRK